MRVAIDDHLHAPPYRRANKVVGQVQPVRIAVDFEELVEPQTRRHDCVPVGFNAFARIYKPASWMRDAVDRRVFQGGEEARGHDVARLTEAAMDRGDTVFMRGQDLVRDLQSALRRDVHLEAVHQADARVRVAQGIELTGSRGEIEVGV